MVDRTVTTSIDPEKCSGCGLCIAVCPSQTLSMENGLAVVTGDKSLSCGHCMAVCPESAVQVHAIDQTSLKFQTFSLNQSWMGYGQFPTADLARLMASRRSCRTYSKKPVALPVLNDLIQLSTFAPSGTNSQKWTFTCLSTREKVMEFGQLIASFFKKINKKAENRFLRTLLKVLGKPELDTYYSEYYDSVKEAVHDLETHQVDRLFHGASACILIGSAPGASCPKEDAILAAGNLLLAAHTMGLGTCMIGFAVEALKNDPAIARKLHIPDREKIHAVIAIGYPNEKYQTLTGRKKAATRFF